HFEEQLTNLQQVRDELSGELKTEQQATAQSRKRSTDLENRLRTNTAELERVKTDRDKHAQEHARLESDLRAQLTSAKAAAGQAQAALKEEAARHKGSEQPLPIIAQDSGLRQEPEAAKAAAAEAQAGLQEKSQRAEKLEQDLAGLWQTCDELHRNSVAERRASAEAKERVDQLEDRLRQSVAELARAKAALDNQPAEQA